MSNSPTLPKRPELLDSDCESATHKCGQCGKKYNFGEFADSRSPCCSVVCYRLQGGPIFALGGLPSEGGKETIDWYLSQGTSPGQEMTELGHSIGHALRFTNFG
jgi:hypothetical protein